MIWRVTLLSLMVAGPAFGSRYAPAEDESSGSLNQTQIRFLPGYGYAGVQNQDGSKAVFAGPHLGAELDISFTPPVLDVAIGLFGHYQYSTYSNQKRDGGENQDLVKTEFLYGLKGYMKSIYAGFGYGNTSSKFTNSLGNKMELQGQMIGVTAGTKLFSIGKNWNVGFTGWYKSVFFNKGKNPSLSQSTAMETLELSITISLSDFFVFL